MQIHKTNKINKDTTKSPTQAIWYEGREPLNTLGLHGKVHDRTYDPRIRSEKPLYLAYRPSRPHINQRQRGNL